MAERTENTKFPGRSALLLAVVLLIMTLTAFRDLRSASFVKLDDDACVTDNRFVQEGLSGDNVKRAFSTTLIGNYIPLAQLSHMLDCELYGLNAGWHHITSVIIHALNALLLFAFLLKATGAAWRSFMVAALFAIHPLHVESVAWIAERKDLLCAFFWFAGLLAYAFYTEKRTIFRYSLVLTAFILGLLSKPMILTFPFLLLLLDVWPLGRWQLFEGRSRSGIPRFLMPPIQLITEKIPLLILVPVFSVVALSAQEGAIATVRSVPMGHRISNALISYSQYLGSMIFPSCLTPFYPLPPVTPSIWKVLLCGTLLLVISWAVLRFGKDKSHLTTGWFWYLGTLVPVIGLLQIGLQARADRYTYVPLVGIFILITWGSAAIASAGKPARSIVVTTSAVVLAVLTFLSGVQAGYWKDSETLFAHTLACTSDNSFIHYNMGLVLADKGRTDEAEAHFREVIRIDLLSLDAYINLGKILACEGRYAEALEIYGSALKISPDSKILLSNLGDALIRSGRPAEAAVLCRKAIQTDPDFYEGRCNLGIALASSGEYNEAIAQFREAVRLRPDSAEALNNLGLALSRAGDQAAAIEQYEKAISAAPENVDSYRNMGVALWKLGRLEEAVRYFEKVVEIAPDSEQAARDLEAARKALEER